ncbi:MAG: hypothetical protein OXR66_07670 [Candidatus Woesearchaeota archaeon]|nr:hypothetical protein [Candidatus Woesearchaeota archaeon]
MKYLALIGLLCIIACTTTEPPAAHHMDEMPCHQMPDGSWMGDCGDTQNMDEMPCHQMPDGSWMGQCDSTHGEQRTAEDDADDPDDI